MFTSLHLTSTNTTLHQMSTRRKSTPSVYKEAGSPRKSRMKEAKETRQLFEAIAKKLLVECTTNSNHKLESFCTELINKRFTEIRQDIVIMESSLSSRVSQIEHKVSKMCSKLADISTDVVRQNTLLREEFVKLTQSCSTGLEAERQKRLNSAKKLQNLTESAVEQCKSLASCSNKEYMAAVSSLNEDFRIQAKEIARVKESVDDVLVKRHGFIPGAATRLSGENLATTFNQGLDAGVILDCLAQRVRHLEQQVLGEDDWEQHGLEQGLDSSFQRGGAVAFGGARGSSSPLKSLAGGTVGFGGATVSKKLAAQKMCRLEESIYELRAQLQSCESDIHEVKSTVVSKLRGIAANGNSPVRGLPGSHANALHSYEDLDRAERSSAAEVRALHKKVKKLAENTTRACRSLSTGMSEVQQATLNLYTWTDTAYDAFGKVSHELGLKGNVCSRARVYQPTHKSLGAHDLFAD